MGFQQPDGHPSLAESEPNEGETSLSLSLTTLFQPQRPFVDRGQYLLRFQPDGPGQRLRTASLWNTSYPKKEVWTKLTGHFIFFGERSFGPGGCSLTFFSCRYINPSCTIFFGSVPDFRIPSTSGTLPRYSSFWNGCDPRDVVRFFKHLLSMLPIPTPLLDAPVYTPDASLQLLLPVQVWRWWNRLAP